MPQPTIGDVHVDRPLTNLSVAWIQSQTDFVAARVFPVVGVAARSDLYYEYDRGDWMRIVAEKRAPGTPSAGGGYTVSTSSYFADRFSIHQDVDDLTRANADSPLAPDSDATQWVSEQMLRLREQEWATKYFAASVWTNEQDGVAAAPGANEFLRWDLGGSTPIDDVNAQALAMAELTGFKPNGIVTTPAVWNALRNHADIIERIKYTQTGIVSAQLLATLFEVQDFHVAWGISNTATEGATDAFSFLLGKHMLLYYAAPSPGLRQPSAGYTFAWTGLQGASAAGDGVRIKRFRIEENESDRIEADMAWDQKLVALDLGVFFATAVTP